MSVDRTIVKQSYVQLAPGQSVVGVVPYNPNRVFLELQVVSLPEAILYRWDNAVQNDGGDFVLAALEYRQYKDPCPIQRLSVSNPGASPASIAFVEGLVIK